jgi:acetylornithine deacetylase/succinyl-diaminopimelate desuccinylase-like protein
MNTRVLSLLTIVVLVAGADRADSAENDLAPIKAEITKRHNEAVKRLQDWIHQVSIAAEDRGYPEGAEYMAKLARDAGFQQATVINTDGKPGVFATLNAGAPKTVGLYFMYDVKQFDPAEWMSPPTEARLVDKPPLGKVMIGRGAVNQKGPEAAVLAALHAIRGAGKKMPVNLVLVAEGEEEIGSPHIKQLAHRPEVREALAKCVGVFMPSATQDLDGVVTVNLGSKGVIELELVSSGEKWGRGPAKDIHSSLKAMVDSPAWHLVKALDTLVSDDGNEIMIDNYPKPRPLSAEEKTLIKKVSKVRSEAQAKKQYSVQHWINNLPWEQANERLESSPTVNIEGLVGGYTGPGGKTILPHRAVAKIDMRLVPDMKAADALAALKTHLAKRGFGVCRISLRTGEVTSRNTAKSRSRRQRLQQFGVEINLRACQNDRYRAGFLCVLGLLAEFRLVDAGYLRFGFEIDRRDLWTAADHF